MMNISSDMARELQKLFLHRCEIVSIELLYEREVRKYVMKIEEAHKKASKSKLVFR